MAAFDGSITLRTDVDTSGIRKGAKNIKSALGGLSSSLKSIGAAVGVAFGISQLVQFGKQAVKLASDIEEVQNVVDVAFGAMAYKMEQFADTAIEQFGISELTAKQTGSSYMAMAKGMQIADETASDMALTLTGLSADMASFYNISQEEAKTALAAVFTGETETLKRYGVLITEVNLQEYARQQGIEKSINDMTQQEKVMLRYNYILNATALAQGDFVRTQDSWANQTRILSERWKQMQAEFGAAVKAITSLFLPALNTLIDGLTSVASVARKAAENIAMLFGRTITKESGNVAQNTSDINDAADGASDSMDDFADATKKSNKQAKKLLANFDEINILAEKTADTEMEANLLPGGSYGMNGSFDPRAYANEVTGALAMIMEAVGGALIAVGLILLGFGQIGWGIGFIIAGVAIFAIGYFGSSDSAIDDETKQMLTDIMSVAGYALSAIGLILLMLGQVGWGIGFILAGAASLAVSAAMQGAFSAENIKATLTEIFNIAKWALTAIGVMLLCFGHIGWGIGFILAGAVAFAVSAAMQGSFDTGQIKAWLSEFGVVISEALVVIGVLLLFFGQVGWGIGFIIAGVAMFAITEATVGSFSAAIITAWLAEITVVVGQSLVAIGVILLFLGNWEWGIGFIIGGAFLLGISAMMQGEDVTLFVAEKLAILAVYVSEALMSVGVVMLLLGHITWGIGFIIAGAALFAITECVAEGLNLAEIQAKLTTIMAYVVTAMFAVGVVVLLTGNIPMGLGLIAVGAVMYASYVQPNWNLVPEQTRNTLQVITALVTAAAFAIGVVVLLAGNIPMGLALMGVGAMGLFGALSMNNAIDGSALQNQMAQELAKINATAQNGVNQINNTLAGIQMPGASYSSIGTGRISYGIPRLASGAVIPPNREFLAVLGDQKSGTNVEAPLSTIKQAVSEVIGSMGGMGGNQTVVLELNGRELGRTNIEQNKREFARVGTSLLT